MSVIQYSPHPASFYTITNAAGERVGLGAGHCATNPGLWNIAYLTLKQLDAFELETVNPKEVPIWSPAFLKPFTDTAAFELSGTAVGDLATMLHAKGFVDYLLTHPDSKSIPLVITHTIGVLVTMKNRATKAVNIRSGEILRPPGVVVHEPADVNRAKITSLGDWAANLVKGALH